MDDKAIEKAAGEVAAPFQEAKDLYMAKEVKEAFIDGAHFAISELTRWRDPAVELPENLQTTLVKLNTDVICSAEFTCNIFGQGSWDCEQVYGDGDPERGDFSVEVIGWRPI